MFIYGKIAKLKSYFKRITISQWYSILPIVFVLIIAAAFRLYNIDSHRAIYADESLISYVAFAWMKFGAVPYRDIWAPQSYNPLMYIAYQLSYQIFGFNALAIRMVIAVPGIVSVFLIYLIGRKLFGHKVGLVGSFIYAIYIPFSVELEHSFGTAHSLVGMFVLTALFFLLKGISHEKKAESNILIAVSGVFLFLTISIKPYLLLIFLVALGIIAYSYGFQIRRLLRPCAILFAAFLGSFLILVLYLYLNGMLQSWIYTFQIGNLPVSTLPIEEKLVRFGDYLRRILFIQMFAIPVVIWGFFKRNKEIIYLFFWAFIPAITVSLGRFTAGSLFFTFAPLVILSSVSIVWLLRQTTSKIRVRDVNAVLPAAVLILALLTANAYTNFAYYATYMYSVNPEVNAQISVGEVIANITRPTDKIFVTDTALAVLSQRQVITVGPIKAAGFYNDLMGYSYETYIGIPGYPEGIINNDMILSALELQKPAVIVISKHDVFGMLDEIIWTGGQEQIYRPLGPYIMRNYALNKTIEYDVKRWEIWSYNPGYSQELNVFSDQSNIIQIGNQNVSVTFSFQSSNCNYSSYMPTDSHMPTDQSSILSINYTFPVREHAFVRPTIEFRDSVNIAHYRNISLWVKGDNSLNNLWLDLIDNKGRQIGIAPRNLKFFGWKNIIVDINKFAEQGIDTTAIKQIRISIDNEAKNTGSGTVTLTHLTLLS